MRAGVPACVRACVRAGGRACMCNLPWATATSASAFLRSDVWASCSQAARALLFHARTHTPSHLQTHILCSQAARALLFHCTHAHTLTPTNTHIMFSSCSCVAVSLHARTHPRTYKHTHACMHDVRRLFFSIASDAPSLFMHAFCCADEWP